jgi:hypothetical protein
MTPSLTYPRRATARDLLFFTTPRLWRWYPFLPVVRWAGPGTARQCGVLYDARGVSGTYGYGSAVFLVNFFALPRTEAALLAGPRLVYDSPEELADAGWAVD